MLWGTITVIYKNQITATVESVVRTRADAGGADVVACRTRDGNAVVPGRGADDCQGIRDTLARCGGLHAMSKSGIYVMRAVWALTSWRHTQARVGGREIVASRACRRQAVVGGGAPDSDGVGDIQGACCGGHILSLTRLASIYYATLSPLHRMSQATSFLLGPCCHGQHTVTCAAGQVVTRVTRRSSGIGSVCACDVASIGGLGARCRREIS
jgi:hypothetical protein